jgi:predicted aldo/keto reductase-like oxidoreductase
MNYRALGKTGMSVSEIGFGGEHLEGKDAQLIDQGINLALDNGINFFDIFMPEPNVRTNIGNALQGKRDKAHIQGHIRAIWKNGQYGRTLDIAECQVAFNDLMTRLQTDYIDVGMIHMVDSEGELETILNGPISEYARKMKSAGTIRSIGMSSHNPVVALKAVKTGLIDVLMFSLNPAFDMVGEDEMPWDLSRSYFEDHQVNGINHVRDELYKTCGAMGVAITVMKSLGAGSLLNAKSSPFGVALTVPQCIHYALTRPAVASVMVGLKTVAEIEDALKYGTSTEAEKDYTFLLSSQPRFNFKGHCMYCNHCLPCSAELDIAQINKYLDMAELEGSVSPTLKEHYGSLTYTASDCIECGICEPNCPFGVAIINRMQRAVEVFGK